MWFRLDAGFSEPQALADRQTPAFGEARKDEGRAAVGPDELILRWRFDPQVGGFSVGESETAQRLATPAGFARNDERKVDIEGHQPAFVQKLRPKNLDQRRIGPLLFHLSRAY